MSVSRFLTFHVRGVPVHLSFLMVHALVIGMIWSPISWVPLGVVLTMIVGVMLHELAHAVVATVRKRTQVTGIFFGLLGGKVMVRRGQTDFWAVAAGPLATILYIFTLFAIALWFGGSICLRPLLDIATGDPATVFEAMASLWVGIFLMQVIPHRANDGFILLKAYISHRHLLSNLKAASSALAVGLAASTFVAMTPLSGWGLVIAMFTLPELIETILRPIDVPGNATIVMSTTKKASIVTDDDGTVMAILDQKDHTTAAVTVPECVTPAEYLGCIGWKDFLDDQMM